MVTFIPYRHPRKKQCPVTCLHRIFFSTSLNEANEMSGKFEKVEKKNRTTKYGCMPFVDLTMHTTKLSYSIAPQQQAKFRNFTHELFCHSIGLFVGKQIPCIRKTSFCKTMKTYARFPWQNLHVRLDSVFCEVCPNIWQVVLDQPVKLEESHLKVLKIL